MKPLLSILAMLTICGLAAPASARGYWSVYSAARLSFRDKISADPVLQKHAVGFGPLDFFIKKQLPADKPGELRYKVVTNRKIDGHRVATAIVTVRAADHKLQEYVGDVKMKSIAPALATPEMLEKYGLKADVEK